MYLVIISALELKVKKKNCHSVRKTFDFSQNSSVSFHRVTFDHSISCVLYIDKPDESCKAQKNVKEMPYPPQKKAFKKKRKSITPAKTNVPIS